MTIVLGIDGGGTGTQALVADETGYIYATSTVGPTNPNAVSRSQLKETITNIMTELHTENPTAFGQIACGFAGMSGSGDSEKSHLVESVLAEAAPDFPIRVDNDAINALYAETLGEPGIVQIAGTGSITFGLNESGETARIGGWGYLFGDEGSGYAIGQSALQAVFQAYDGKVEADVITRHILSYAQIQHIPDLIPFIYESLSPRETIAKLTRPVFQAYDDGDALAIRLIQQAADDLTLSIQTMLNRHFQHNQEVVLAGGLFKRRDVLPTILNQQLSVPVRVLEREPVVGAVVAALQDAGAVVQPEFKSSVDNASNNRSAK
ncbi:N-acetylglucosamine kinase [Aquisalibacillus elongatus]|uniref:N-acetylglucosamine kinase-like BadF-type ATPase n=1 Tax=Aquisalibacillus elongatus TaxID=485577 RepID=A0A3N5B0K6_9BACI|nr:BadF/BadG/BcrA/BcrD ATPase family protein [Aquisalibacillus elongatus]RPF51096.1 N-acetylglucosamine kinase-like BadF-type ATPase [Aquisalibacillus elongatus]